MIRRRTILGGIVVLMFLGAPLLWGEQKPETSPSTPRPIRNNSLDRDHQPGSTEGSSSRDSAFVKPDSSPASTLVQTQAQNISRSPIAVMNNKEYPVRTYRPLMMPNDPLASQWWVTHTKLNQAWDSPAGGRQTLLAIIDTGFALNHEEFANRWYANSGESGTATSENPSLLNCTDRGIALDASCNLIDENGDGVVDNEFGPVEYQNASRRNCSGQARPLTRDCNRIDDDNNGHIDDTKGWDFINHDNSPQAGELNPYGEGTTHGTNVAGVAAATGNNAKGLAGVDWQTKILPLQALDDDAYGDTLSVGRAIEYAADQGADVISVSLGSDLPDDYVRQAIRTAIARGSVVVAASGNDGCDCMVYPAHYPEVVAVGALASNNQPAYFSSWGSNLDILAPGTNISSVTWTAGNGATAYVSGINGTSFATPLVSGMLTRLLSQRPEATPLQLIAALTESTNRLGLASTTPHSATFGYGTVDAFKATQRATVPVHLSQTYAFTPVSQGRQSGLTASEVAGTHAVQACPGNIISTTPVYELTKSGITFFTVSSAEVWKAQQSGYAAALFGRACMQQPHDTTSVMRNLNILTEFKNSFIKPSS